jgi:hypothetical protein
MIIKPNNLDLGSIMLPYVPGPSTYSSETNFFQTTFPLQFSLIAGATAVTPGGTYYEINVLGRKYHAIQVSGPAYNATVLLEGTLDGINWITIQSITAVGIYQYTGIYQSLRVSITAYTAGTIAVTAITQRD